MNITSARRPLLLIAASAGLACSAAAHAAATLVVQRADHIRIGERLFIGFAERQAMPKPAGVHLPDGPSRLVVKFRDDLRARAVDGRLATPSTGALAPAHAIVAREGLRLQQLIQLDDARLDVLEASALQRTGIRPIDLRGMLVVDLAADATDADRRRVAEALLALDSVEWVEFESLTPTPPPCEDLAPVSSSFVSLQGYRGPDPGVNMNAAWAAGFARGEGVRFADIEYYFHPDHEDLCGIIAESGQTIPSFVFANGWDNHGTAVLGIVNGVENAYGVSGLTPAAQGYFFPEFSNEQGSRRATAITNAAATLGPGDVIMLEMQTTGADGGFAPAEYTLSVWNATKAATDAGRIIIAAAGNGNQNLDSTGYVSYRARGDSGAIIVGAGSANTNHDKLSFSTFGSRVNIQGWGQSVVSTGYGGLAEFGGDENQAYTSGFGGTSSATPIVSGAAISLQSYARNVFNTTIDPFTMRQLLAETGIPQGSGGNIGPFPDVMAARAALPDYITLPPLTPELLSPADGDTVALPVALLWTTDPAAQSYTLTIDNDPAFTSPEFQATLFTGQIELDAPPLAAGVTYFWRINATNDAGSTPSTVFSFTTTPACPADVTGDAAVDLADLNLVLSNFASATSAGDTNGDGVVDLSDLNAVLAAFGSSCP